MLEKAHRSTRRFEKNVDRAIAIHQSKLDEGFVSLPPEQGKLVIIPSRGTTVNSRYSASEQIRVFGAEAEQIAASPFANQYAASEVMPAFTSMDVSFALADPEVAGLVLIGHGTIAAFRLHQDKYMNWHDTARQTRQLKLGHFVQRMCGEFRLHDSLPMGTFAVADQRHVLAAVGVPVDDKYPDESLFRPVYTEPVNDAQSIFALRDQYWTGELSPR